MTFEPELASMDMKPFSSAELMISQTSGLSTPKMYLEYNWIENSLSSKAQYLMLLRTFLRRYNVLHSADKFSNKKQFFGLNQSFL